MFHQVYRYNDTIMATVEPPSIESIKAGFPNAQFTVIADEPTFEQIEQLETKAIRNVATVECRIAPPHENLCGLIKQPSNYLLRVGTAFPIIPYPGDAPTIPARTTEANKEKIKNK